MSTKFDIHNNLMESIFVYFRYQTEMVGFILQPQEYSSMVYNAWETNSIIVIISESGLVWRINQQSYLNNVYNTSYIINTCLEVPNDATCGNGYVYSSVIPSFRINLNGRKLTDLYKKVIFNCNQTYYNTGCQQHVSHSLYLA